ncbi:MAG: LysM peptidoglycan-binding domain-containing protein [Candidatus Omnitrophota bacterium]|nr:LysM peptidoglycan-binding domain-containing protein [Candidatus Omnitrophota bacterium]
MSKYLVLFGFVFLSGCLARTYTLTKPRVDTEIKGNRGYLSGAPAQETVAPSRLGDTRKTSVLEIELGPHPRSSASKTLVTAPRRKAVQKEDSSQGIASQETEEIVDEIIEETTYREYIVEKGDTLQKISQKFYGTTKKWQMLYQENKDILKGPDKVYPGIKIRIPQEKQ